MCLLGACQHSAVDTPHLCVLCWLLSSCTSNAVEALLTLAHDQISFHQHWSYAVLFVHCNGPPQCYTARPVTPFTATGCVQMYCRLLCQLLCHWCMLNAIKRSGGGGGGVSVSQVRFPVLSCAGCSRQLLLQL
jgi:hypothetical protein